MGNSQSDSGYLSISDSNFCMNIRRYIENLEAEISKIRQERILELCLSSLKNIQNKK